MAHKDPKPLLHAAIEIDPASAAQTSRPARRLDQSSDRRTPGPLSGARPSRASALENSSTRFPSGVDLVGEQDLPTGLGYDGADG